MSVSLELSPLGNGKASRMLTKAIVTAVKDVTWQSTKESGVLSLHLEIICHFPSARITQAKLGRCYGKDVGDVTGSSNLNIERGKSEESKKESREEIHNQIYIFNNICNSRLK